MNTKEIIKKNLKTLKSIRDRCERADRDPNAREALLADRLLDEISTIEWSDKLPAGEQYRTPVDSRMGGTYMGGSVDYETQAIVGRPTYRKLFGKPRENGDFKSFREFLLAVASGRADDRLKTRDERAMVESDPSSAGFLVPDEHSSEIIDMVLEKSIILPRAQVYPMKSKTLKVDAIDDNDHSSSRGGLVAQWTGEGGTMNPDDIEVRQLQFTARKLTLLLKVSDEFLADAPGADAMIKSAVGAEVAWQLDHVFINSGTGAGQPLSILNSDGCKSVAKASGQGASTYIWENAVAQHEAFNPGGEANGLYLMSPSLKSQAFTMSQAVGTGGDAFWPALSQASGKIDLLGLPVRFTEHCKAKGTKGDSLLINPRKYAVGLRQELKIESSKHVYFTTGFTCFRAVLRIDAMPINSEVLTLSDGSTEVADFVTLDARA